jgi:hypothetical protein
LNGTYKLLVYADNVNIMDEKVYNIKKNTKVLVIATEENGVGVNADSVSTWSCHYNRTR